MPNLTTSDGTPIRLTPEQARTLLVLCNAAEGANDLVQLVYTTGHNPIRETATGTALVRKGLAKRHHDGRFYASTEGFWMGDALRAADRRGEIPARRS